MCVYTCTPIHTHTYTDIYVKSEKKNPPSFMFTIKYLQCVSFTKDFLFARYYSWPLHIVSNLSFLSTHETDTNIIPIFSAEGIERETCHDSTDSKKWNQESSTGRVTPGLKHTLYQSDL